MASGRRDAMHAMPRIPLPYTPTHRTLLRPRIVPLSLHPLFTPLDFLHENEAVPSRIYRRNRMLIGKYWWDFPPGIRSHRALLSSFALHLRRRRGFFFHRGTLWNFRSVKPRYIYFISWSYKTFDGWHSGTDIN